MGLSLNQLCRTGKTSLAGFACAVLMTMLANGTIVWAQDASRGGFTARQPEHAPTPADLLREFDAPAETDYRLAEGDEIHIDVWGRSELSGKHVIGPDGKITLPYAGSFKVADLTRDQVEATALKLWQDSYEDLKVSVGVEHYVGEQIYVLGRVATPGAIHFDRQPTLLEAISRAGSLPVTGSLTDRSPLTRCIVFRGSDKIAWIDLRGLLNGSNLALNIHLQRDDTLYIPDGDDQLVYVMGEVLRPGAVRLTQNMTFMAALAQAGGPTKDAGNKIHLVRHSTGTDLEITMNQIVNRGSDPDVTLENGDILYVGRSGLAKVGYVMMQLSPATSYLLFATGVKNF
jgi:polysaccharide biosynthesis/export protein